LTWPTDVGEVLAPGNGATLHRQRPWRCHGPLHVYPGSASREL